MSIFPQTEKTLVRIFHCPICEKNYIMGDSSIVCAVNHSPGSCCHYTDKELTEEMEREILDRVANIGI